MKTYTLEAIETIYNQPFMDLVYEAMGVHREHHERNGLKLCYAKSIKSGGCPENCAYCPQSAHHKTFVKNEKMLSEAEIMEAAEEAREAGVSRFCMGTAWGKAPKGESFDRLTRVIPRIREMGLEVCCSTGSVDEAQIEELKDAGCSVYNYNIDTSPEYYEKIITTRSYEDRMGVLKRIQDAGVSVCCGGIVGMGESLKDRLVFLKELTEMSPRPESVPLNLLHRVEGTPLANAEVLDWSDYIRVVAVARILMPEAILALAAGRDTMSEAMQALCFMAGANSIITGAKVILTTKNPDPDFDKRLMEKLNLHGVN